MLAIIGVDRTGRPRRSVTVTTSPVDTTGGDTTGEPLPGCTPSIDDALDPHVYINGILYTDCQI